ncbi:MAG TPA: hypothetical protein VM616_06845 [Gammaproteobacteria bacterium]|nr:hypothetical protein [Gammaproteobacteria bacterium]
MTETTEGPDKASPALERATAALPREIEPARDLWPGIEACIRDERTGARRTTWLGRMAAAVALLAAGSLATFMLLDRPAHTPQTVVEHADGGWADSLADVWAEPARFGTHHALGEDYLRTRAELTTTLEQRLATLSPETRTVVIDNLIEIRSALDAINAALAEDPDNILLQRLLLTAYQDEMFVLADLNSSTDPIRERIDL